LLRLHSDQSFKQPHGAGLKEKDMKDIIIAYAAWHPTKGFDEYHYEGPIAFADLEEEDGIIEVVKDLNESEGTNEWRAVKVEIRRIP
jgi:hypothetical protein